MVMRTKLIPQAIPLVVFNTRQPREVKMAIISRVRRLSVVRVDEVELRASLIMVMYHQARGAIQVTMVLELWRGGGGRTRVQRRVLEVGNSFSEMDKIGWDFFPFPLCLSYHYHASRWYMPTSIATSGRCTFGFRFQNPHFRMGYLVLARFTHRCFISPILTYERCVCSHRRNSHASTISRHLYCIYMDISLLSFSYYGYPYVIPKYESSIVGCACWAHDRLW